MNLGVSLVDRHGLVLVQSAKTFSFAGMRDGFFPAPKEVSFDGNAALDAAIAHDTCEKSAQEKMSSLMTFSVARRVSVKAALLGALVMAPIRALLSQMAGSVDFMEVACSPVSFLSAAFENQGFTIQRVNYREGFDLESKAGTAKLFEMTSKLKPRFMWVSLPCRRLSSLVNLTQRTPEEWANFYKRQGRDLRRAQEVSTSVCAVLDQGGDFAWEWLQGLEGPGHCNHPIKAA